MKAQTNRQARASKPQRNTAYLASNLVRPPRVVAQARDTIANIEVPRDTMVSVRYSCVPVAGLTGRSSQAFRC